MKWEKFISAGFRMPFYMNLFVNGHVSGIKKVTGWDGPQVLVAIERQMNTVYQSPAALAEYRSYIKPKLSDKTFRDHFVLAINEADRELLEFCQTLYFQNFAKTNLAELVPPLKRFVELFSQKFGVYGLPKFTDLVLAEILPELLSKPLSDGDLAELTKPNTASEYIEERISFLTLAKEIKNQKLKELFAKSTSEVIDQLGRFYPTLYYQIELHVRKFVWLNTSHHVQGMNLDQAIINLKQTLLDTTFEKELLERQTETEHTLKQQIELTQKLNLIPSDLEIINFIKNLNEINESRKAAMSKALLWSYPLFQALADKLNTDVISLRQLTAEEILSAIETGTINPELKQTISERLGDYVCLLEQGIVTNFSGEKAKEIAARELGVSDYASLTEVKGRVAQVGVVTGKVRLILSEHQVENLLSGEILVTSMTDPNMVPAMKRAAAIVTDEGGITCHAAIVSRELGIPCVIGTKIATKVFKNGDLVEVDAKNGLVKKI